MRSATRVVGGSHTASATRPLGPAAALVGLRGVQVPLPAEVVDVDGGPVGIQVPDLVDDGLEQLDVKRTEWRSTRALVDRFADGKDTS